MSLNFDFSFVQHLSLEDGTATLTEFTSHIIISAIKIILFSHQLFHARGTWKIFPIKNNSLSQLGQIFNVEVHIVRSIPGPDFDQSPQETTGFIRTWLRKGGQIRAPAGRPAAGRSALRPQKSQDAYQNNFFLLSIGSRPRYMEKVFFQKLKVLFPSLRNYFG